MDQFPATHPPGLARQGRAGRLLDLLLHQLPALDPLRRAWAKKYGGQGLVVIGVHAPEFAFEKDLGNVGHAVRDLGIAYPVAVDNDAAIWNGFHNNYWPAHYFIDGEGRIRAHHFGEGDYDQSERIIQQLLAANGDKGVVTSLVNDPGRGVGAAASGGEVQSPETYIGYERGAHPAGVGRVQRDKPHDYALAPLGRLNDWSLGGAWRVEVQRAVSTAPGARLAYRFHARDLHLVLGTETGRAQVRFRITLDGKPPGADHGLDVDAQGDGVITEQRLYQMVRQGSRIEDRTFEIEFLDPGVEAYTFTFG
jgi:hypothetical protein